MKASKYILFVEEEIKKAEIIQSLKCNQIISLFKPTEIGKGLKQSFPIQRLLRDTTKWNKIQIHHSVSYFPYLKDLSLEDLKDTVFTFQFDESTTYQVNERYDGHVQHWSKSHTVET